MQARRAQAVAEEFETMRAIAKKEREVAKKLEAVRIETEARIAKEAALRDAERKKKVEEKLKKSQAILKEIERKGEESRLRAVEKEKRIQAILEVRVPCVVSLSRLGPFGPRRDRICTTQVKKAKKKEEIRIAREKAEKRIAAALEANNAKQRRKREVFDAKQVEVRSRRPVVLVAISLP